MIKAIIFDFGDVFINLDKEGTIERAKTLIGEDIITEREDAADKSIFEINDHYEKGLISTNEFISFYTNLKKEVSDKQLIALWNSLLLDFPKYRLEFIQTLAKENKYKLILLSNTNELHIDWIKKNVPFYDYFKKCFDAFYLSHEVHLRKPDEAIFNFVLEKNNLKAEDCFFIDDTVENTQAAESIGIKSWHIDEKNEDIVNLFDTYKDIFQ